MTLEISDSDKEMFNTADQITEKVRGIIESADGRTYKWTKMELENFKDKAKNVIKIIYANVALKIEREGKKQRKKR